MEEQAKWEVSGVSMNEREENSAPPAAVPEKQSSDSAPAPAPAAPEQKSADVAPAEKPAVMAQKSSGTAQAAVYTVPAPNASTADPAEKPAVPAPVPSPATPEPKTIAVAPLPAIEAESSESMHTTFKFQDNQPVTASDTGRDTLFVTSPNTTPPVTAPKSAGQTCPKCGHLNRAGILVCEKCGTLLIGDEQAGGTKRFEAEKRAAAAANGQPALIETTELFTAAISSAGSSQFTENMILRLEIEGAPTPIMVHPKFETSLGRRDPATGTMPDVDLSAYAGYRLGVSRKHAVIRLKNRQLELYDLGSSNGTSINGTRLNPHQSQILRDGDEVLLGKMMMRVLFQVRSRRA